MKMISFAVKKGRVGKTTFIFNLAGYIAKENKKALLIDLDPQATLSVQFVSDNVDTTKSIMKNIKLLLVC